MPVQKTDEAGVLIAIVWRRCHGRVRDLRLEVRGGGLVLQGRAPSYHAKQLAQQAVLEAGGLPLAANEIEVAAGAWAAEAD
jgi:hypothetical protein